MNLTQQIQSIHIYRRTECNLIQNYCLIKIFYEKQFWFYALMHLDESVQVSRAIVRNAHWVVVHFKCIYFDFTFWSYSKVCVSPFFQQQTENSNQSLHDRPIHATEGDVLGWSWSEHQLDTLNFYYIKKLQPCKLKY